MSSTPSPRAQQGSENSSVPQQGQADRPTTPQPQPQPKPAQQQGSQPIFRDWAAI